MTILLVRSTGVQTGGPRVAGANSDTASFGALPAVNNHIIGGLAGWSNDPSDNGLDNFTDNQGNTYTRHINPKSVTNQCYAGGSSAKVATSSGTFTVGINLTAGTNNYVAWNASEFSGLDTSSWFDQSGINDSTTGDANATAAGANATADGLAVGVCSVNNGDSDINIDDTPPSGYTNLAYYNDGSSIIGYSMVYRIYSSSETSAVQWVHDNTSQTGWAAGVMTFKAAGGGGAAGQPTMRRWKNVPFMKVPGV